MDEEHLRRLVSVACERTEHVSLDVSPRQLFEDASRAALRIPEPLGSAIAGVLAMEAKRREARGGYDGLLAESSVMIALAIVAMEYATPASGGEA